MKDQIKFSIVTTAQVTAMCLSATLLYIIIEIIFGSNYSYYFAINPITSGLLHSNSEHLLWNMFGIFISLNMRCNRFYTFEKIFWVTALIAVLYLPIILINSGFASIGISGTCYFLLMRGIGSFGRFKPLMYFIMFSILIGEIIRIGDNDTIAHLVHAIGSILGIVSLYPGKLKFLPEKIYEIIS